MMVIAKMADSRIVHVVKHADTVDFSKERGWFCVCFDFEQSSRKWQSFKWVRDTTRFVWARDFEFVH